VAAWSKALGMRTIACWDCQYESRWKSRYLFLVSVVCSQEEVSASGRSPIQRNPAECGVSECDREAVIMRKFWPIRCC
jgi:hypothetical protein